MTRVAAHRGVLAGLCAAVVSMAALGACGSTTGTAAKSTRTTTAPPTSAPVSAPVVASGLPADAVVVSVSVDGTTGWALLRGHGAGVWRVPASGKPTRVVDQSAYHALADGSPSVVALPGGVAALGQKCPTSTEQSIECASSTGIVELFDDAGHRTHTVTLWKDKAAPAGGSPPTLLAVTPSGLWIGGMKNVYAVSSTGEVTETVPRKGGTNACVMNGDLYALDWGATDKAADPGNAGTARVGTAGLDGGISLVRWSDGKWSPVPDSTVSGAGLPSSSCGAAGIMLWSGNGLSKRWLPGKGWKPVPDAAHTRPQKRSNAGVGYVLPATGTLQRIDPTSGRLVDLDLELVPKEPASGQPHALVVAERGRSVFACSYSATRSNDSSETSPTRCGFAPIPD